MRALAVIPARLASTRLPRKVLREIAGRSMLAHVVEGTRGCSQISDVIVATDSDEILAICKRNGWRAEMTSSSHRSGTDRVWEVAQRIAADVYLNVQADEPLVRPEHIQALLAPLQDARVMVSTIKTPCSAADVDNPNAVKVVTDLGGRALYFTRASVPFDRDNSGLVARFKHLGFYGYRRDALEKFNSWPESELERAERLEQLRFLDHGMQIHVVETPYDTVGVDTEEDLKRLQQMFQQTR